MSAETGRHQQIADANVGRDRHIFEFESIGASGARGDAAEIVAIDLHRHRVRGVDDEHHSTRELRHFDHLPEQTLGIDHRLSDERAVRRALVDLDLIGVGARYDADQLGDEHFGTETLPAAEQLSQSRVLFAQRDELLSDRGEFEVALLELRVLGHQRLARRQRSARLAAHLIRTLGDDVDRTHDRRQHRPHRLQQTGVHVDRQKQRGHDRERQQQVAGARITQE